MISYPKTCGHSYSTTFSFFYFAWASVILTNTSIVNETFIACVLAPTQYRYCLKPMFISQFQLKSCPTCNQFHTLPPILQHCMKYSQLPIPEQPVNTFAMRTHLFGVILCLQAWTCRKETESLVVDFWTFLEESLHKSIVGVLFGPLLCAAVPEESSEKFRQKLSLSLRTSQGYCPLQSRSPLPQADFNRTK